MQSPPDHSAARPDVPLPNHFRRLVESAVQANRQVVESAQRDVLKDATHKDARNRAELGVYKEGYFDTATWLYHVVFSPQVPDLSARSQRTTSAFCAKRGTRVHYEARKHTPWIYLGAPRI
jgi:hypothetical protein